MKVMIAYPPIEEGKGVPLLSQNRQFQWFNKPTYIYPIEPASAATLLARNGHDVIWADGIAEGWTYRQFLDSVRQERPDLIAMETKTPVVKQHWKIINDLKNLSTANCQPSTVLFGDHVTALPEESMKNSKVDFVLTGGDYDFLLLNLCQYLSAVNREPSTKSHLPTANCQPPTRLEPGIYYRQNGEIKTTGPFELNHDLDSLPFVDRDLTKWHLYAYKNGNYKKRPGTYVMAGRDCWWGKCTFCSWVTLYPKYRVRSPHNVLDEIGLLVEKYGVREIMDDTGTFPAGAWLEKFCRGMIERGYNKKVAVNCNVRAGHLSKKQFQLMKQAGFRMVLYGLESADQEILDRVRKGIKVDDVAKDCRTAKECGLSPHLTAMVGYPWETKESAARTIEFARNLFDRRWVESLQASVVIPYPGTALFRECKEKGWLLTDDWERYDMREPVIKSAISNEEIMRLTKGLYKSFLTPGFIMHKLMGVRSLDDIRFLGRQGLSVLSRLREFSGR